MKGNNSRQAPSQGRNGLGPLCVAAYLSFCREELTSNAFAREAAPCGPILFQSSLGAEKGISRQRVVTARMQFGQTHSSDSNVTFCLRDSASWMMPDMSSPSLVRLLELKLR